MSSGEWKLVPIEPTEEIVDALLTGQPEHKRTDTEIRRYFAYIYKLAVAAAPIPPTPPLGQDDEPYAYALVSENHNTLIWSRNKKVVEVCREKYPNGKSIELFSHPQSDKLRKTAEEVLNIVHERNLYSAPLPRCFWDAFDNLRTALEQSG